MFALENSEKIRFFALIFAFLGKFLMIFKNISCQGFNFFARTIPGLEFFQGLYQVIYHCFRVGEKQCCDKKSKLGQKNQFQKSDFFRFYAIIAANTGFRSAALEQRKNTTNSKKWKLSKTLYWTFCQLSFNFRTLVRNFLAHWYNFFYSHYFCFKYGRMLQDADVKMYCNYQIILCLVPEIRYFTCEKWPKPPQKINKFIFVLSKFLHIFCMNILQGLGPGRHFLCRMNFSNVFVGFRTYPLPLFWLLCFFSFSPVWVRQWRHKAITNTSKYSRWKIFSYITLLVDITSAVCELLQKSCSNVNIPASAALKGFLARVKIPTISVEPPFREMLFFRFSAAKFLAHASNK